MRNGVRWLRISSIVSLLFAAGHTMGGLLKDWSPIDNSPVLTAMRTYRVDLQGVTRTYLDFYRGFGLSLSVFMLLQAVLLWQLSTIARTSPAQARPLAAAFAAASISGTIITGLFIFPVPTMFSVAQSVCLAIAFLTLR